MAKVIRTKHILYKGEKIGEVVVEEDTEKGELSVTFRATSGSDKLQFRTDSYGDKEAQFTYRKKKEQAPQTPQVELV